VETLIAILTFLAKIPAIYDRLEKFVDSILMAMERADREKLKKDLREAAVHARERKDQRKLEKALRRKR